jgi:hypothetical protein
MAGIAPLRFGRDDSFIPTGRVVHTRSEPVFNVSSAAEAASRKFVEEFALERSEESRR